MYAHCARFMPKNKKNKHQDLVKNQYCLGQNCSPFVLIMFSKNTRKFLKINYTVTIMCTYFYYIIIITEFQHYTRVQIPNNRDAARNSLGFFFHNQKKMLTKKYVHVRGKIYIFSPPFSAASVLRQILQQVFRLQSYEKLLVHIGG